MTLGDPSEEEVEGIRTGAIADPSVGQVAALASVFGVEPSYLLDQGEPVFDHELVEALRDEAVREATCEIWRGPNYYPWGSVFSDLRNGWLKTWFAITSRWLAGAEGTCAFPRPGGSGPRRCPRGPRLWSWLWPDPGPNLAPSTTPRCGRSARRSSAVLPVVCRDLGRRPRTVVRVDASMK